MENNQHPRNIIGPSVAKHRAEKGWSQSVLAAKCQLSGWNISRSIVAAIEGRVRWVGDWEVVLFAKVFNVAVQDLYPKKINWAEIKLPSEEC